MSTDEQTEYSPEAQLKAIKKYAKQNGIIITKEHIFTDYGLSGKRADKRPAFMQMIGTAKMKPKPFDVILVHKFDRFARSREDSVVYKTLLKKEAGIKVVSITESIEDDKFSVILEAMLEAMAEYYSLNLAEEVKKGMNEKAERGELQSRPAFGYEAVNNKLVINEEEAIVVRFIFGRYGSRQMTMRQLAVHLSNLGIKRKTGKAISAKMIAYILDNPVYIGKLRWSNGKEQSIVRESSHEPIIDVETWQKVQNILTENKELYGKKEKTTSNKVSWLCGLLKCADCGYALVRSSRNYFQCSAYSKGICASSNRIRIDVAEILVLLELGKIYSEKLEVEIVPKTSDTKSRNEKEMLRARLEQTEEKQRRIKEAYQDGIDTLEEYKKNKNNLHDERQRVIEQLEALKKHIVQKGYDEGILTHIKSVHEVLTSCDIDMETKYKTAHFLINKAVFSKEDKVLKLEFK